MHEPPLPTLLSVEPPPPASPPSMSPSRRSVVELLHTTDVLRRRFLVALAPYRVSLPQYNALRILRGAQGVPLTTAAIMERMIEQAVGVGAVLERMEAQGWLRRAPSADASGAVRWQLAPAGDAVLGTLDPVLDAACEAVMAPLTTEARESLAEALRVIREVAVRQDG